MLIHPPARSWITLKSGTGSCIIWPMMARCLKAKFLCIHTVLSALTAEIAARLEISPDTDLIVQRATRLQDGRRADPMDYLEKYEAEQEERRARLALHGSSPHAARADEENAPRTDMPEEFYPVTIIGCIRGVDGWYEAGYDKRKKAIIPSRLIQRRSIYSNDDCGMCANSDPETDTCLSLPIHGGTPCTYYTPRSEP